MAVPTAAANNSTSPPSLPWRRRLGTRIAFLFLLVGLLPLAFSATVALITTRDSLQRAASANLFALGQRVSQEVSSQLASAYETVAALADDPLTRSLETSLGAKEAELRRMERLSAVLEDITLIDPRGNVLASANYRFRGAWAARPWIQEALAGKPAFSDAHLVPDPTQTVIVVASPVRADQGETMAVVAGQINMEQIWRITDEVRVGASGYVILLNRRNDVIAHPQKQRLWEKFANPLDPSFGPEPQDLHYFRLDGTDLVASHVPVSAVGAWGDIGWQVLAIQPLAEAFALMSATMNQALWAAALALAVLAVAALLLTRSISRPVVALAEATRRLSRGELGYRVALERRDELGELASSFNEMSATIAQQRADLEESYQATLQAVATALDLRDHETEAHARRVTILTLAIARRLGVSEGELVSLQRGAFLHDVGKIGVPDAVLLKPGSLTAEEWAEMRRHPEHGQRMLARVPFLADALPVILHHHERWDGSGYPDGLAGEAIPLGGRIFAVADAYDAITSDRPYRPARTSEAAIAEIEAGSGKQFDPEAVAAFVEVMKDEAVVAAIRALADRDEPLPPGMAR